MDKIMKRQIADRIKVLRKNVGLTQEQMAERIGLTYNAYVKLENAYNSPSLKVLISLAEFFNVPTDLIIFGNLDRAKTDVNDYDKLGNLIKICDSEKVQYVGELFTHLLDLTKKR